MSSSRPWFAFYPADYLRDTAHLTMIEDGAYRRMLNHYYSLGRPLTGDLPKLLRILNAHLPEEKTAVEHVLAEFFVLKRGKWHNKRADKEIAIAEKISETKRKAGHAGGIAARGKSGRRANSKTIADEFQNNAQSQSQSHTQSQETKNKIEGGADAPAPSKPNGSFAFEAQKPEAPPKPKRKTALPAIFPAQAELLYASAYWHSVGRADLCDEKSAKREAEKFRDHHLKENKASADWDASWRTWVRNAVEFNRRPPRAPDEPRKIIKISEASK